MSQNYVRTTFLRQTPNALLAEYFAHRGLILPGVDFTTLKKTDTDSILRGMEGLTPSECSMVDAEFSSVNHLATNAGSRLITDLVEFFELGLNDVLGHLENHYARAMWLFLNPVHEGHDLFKACLAVAEAQSLSYTSSRRLKDLPNLPPRFDQPTLERMAEALQDFYKRQGRGYRCKVEHYQRPNPMRHYYIAYPEDYSTSILRYNDDELIREDQSAVFQVAYVYYPEEGKLDLSARGLTRKKDTQELQEVFCRLALGLPGVPRRATDRCYELNVLKRKGFQFPTDLKDGIERVEVTGLRLTHIGNKRRRIMVEQDPASDETLYEWLERVIDQREVDLDMMNVSLARLQVNWYPEAEGKKARHLSFTLGFPNSCSLKDDPNHLVIKRYLKRWNLEP